MKSSGIISFANVE